MFLSSGRSQCWLGRFLVDGAVAKHRPEGGDASPCEGDERLLVGFAFGAVGSARGAVPVFRLVRFLGPPAEPGVPITEHRALHKSRLGGGWSSGCGGPRCWDLRPAVAVADDPHPAWVEEVVLTVGGPPAAVAEATPEFRPGDLAVFASDPSHHPLPGVLGQVLERR